MAMLLLVQIAQAKIPPITERQMALLAYLTDEGYFPEDVDFESMNIQEASEAISIAVGRMSAARAKQMQQHYINRCSCACPKNTRALQINAAGA